MKGKNTHRHPQNPLEKILHDDFVKDFGTGVRADQIVFGISEGPGAAPKEYLTGRERDIVVTMVQWMGSPVGRAFFEAAVSKSENEK